MLRSINSRTIVLFIALLSSHIGMQAQVYSETFNGGFNGWTVQDNVGGVNGGDPNIWYVSCQEEGVAPPGCGSSCIGDPSLHIGANAGAGGDMGATFNETGAVNATFRRVVSPTISTTGFSTLTLSFDFIAFGSSACSDDRAQLHLSTDNGATWPAGFQYCLNSVCCGACNGYSQGQWTLYTMALPAAFNNNPNVRVGFHWRNNGNGSGTDPSVAIDDVRITTTLPVTLTYFGVREQSGTAVLDWTSTSESQLSSYEVQRSADPSNFKTIGTLPARLGNANEQRYTYRDPIGSATVVYYRLKMLDTDGSHTFSQIVRVVRGSTVPVELATIESDGKETYQAVLWAVEALPVQIEVRDIQGRLITQFSSYNLIPGENKVHLSMSNAAAGTYLLTVRTLSVPKGFETVTTTRKFVVR